MLWGMSELHGPAAFLLQQCGFVVNGDCPVSQELAPPGQQDSPAPEPCTWPSCKVPPVLVDPAASGPAPGGASSSVLQRLLLFLSFSLPFHPRSVPWAEISTSDAAPALQGGTKSEPPQEEQGVTGSPGLPQALPLSATV